MTKVLIIGYVWPEPRSSAAGTHMMDLIRLFLQQQWRVTFASPAVLSAHMADLDTMGITKAAIELNSPSFDKFLIELQPEIVMFDRFMMEEQFGWRVEKHCPSALRIVDTQDLHFLRHARHHAFKQKRAVQRSDLFSEMAQREIASIFRSDLSLIISDYEMQLLQNEFSVKEGLLHHCPFMLEPIQSDHQLPVFEQRSNFISIGNFRHSPNWNAVLWLKESIWPAIRQLLPQAELHIYGAYPPPKATALHNSKQGFHVLGWAPDVYEVMKKARVNLAPLQFGAGIKGKLADAMLCGTPSVTTAIGAEGMTGGLPWSGAIAESADALATAAVKLYQEPLFWQDAQNNGLDIIHKMFNKQTIGETLIKRITNSRETLEENRLENFTGAMLRHHKNTSTKYMSRWIETKNRLADLSNSED